MIPKSKGRLWTAGSDSRKVILVISKFSLIKCLSVLLIMAGTNPARANPVLSHSNMLSDFGVIRQGQKITRIFSVANTGSDPVTVKEIVPSLRLVEARIDKPVIPPGDKAQLTVIYDSRYGMGRTEADILLETNCAQSAEMTYRLTGFVFQNNPLGGPSIDPRMMAEPMALISSVWGVVIRLLGIP